MTNVTWPKAILPKSYDFGFTLQLMTKDVGIAMSLIESTGVQTKLAKLGAEMWAETMKDAPAGVDMTEFTRRIMKEAGL